MALFKVTLIRNRDPGFQYWIDVEAKTKTEAKRSTITQMILVTSPSSTF
ncbi:hypothetical protein [Subtercola lobariae]|nr:hypothetical protein [Subtercola lobariae]